MLLNYGLHLAFSVCVFTIGNLWYTCYSYFSLGGGGGGGEGVTHLVPDNMSAMCNTRHSQMGTPPPTVST